MIQLHELTPQGYHALQRWLGQEGQAVELGAEHVVPLPERASVAAAGVGRFARWLEERHPAGDSRLDRELAPWLHRQLPIGRRLGARPALWRWLGAVPLLPLLALRWPRTATQERRHRYAGRVDEHGLGRLWWAAELTVDPRAPEPYLETMRLVRRQYLMDRLVGSQLARTRQVVLGVLDVLGGSDAREVVNPVVRQLGALSSAVCLDALAREEVAALVRELVQQLPPGR